MHSQANLVVYLDTNHLSSLVRHKNSRAAMELLELWERMNFRVALSLVHVLELSHPDFKSGEDVADFLDDHVVAWALSQDDMFQQEVAAACGAFVDRPVPVVPFGHDAGYALGDKCFASSRPSDVIRLFRDDPEIRREIATLDRDGVLFDSLKQGATIVKDPLALLKKMIRQRQPRSTPSGILLPTGIDPDEVLRAVGGIEGFPAYHVLWTVWRNRLKDSAFRAKPNDIRDAYHSCYSPYAAATALDRGTAARVRAMNTAWANKVTYKLRDVCNILMRAAV